MTQTPPVTGWSVNRLAALTVAWNAPDFDGVPLRDRDPAELDSLDLWPAHELLECLGLIEPGGRTILPDDTRNYDVEGNAPDSGSTIGWRQAAPEPRADRRFVPDGLAS